MRGVELAKGCEVCQHVAEVSVGVLLRCSSTDCPTYCHRKVERGFENLVSSLFQRLVNLSPRFENPKSDKRHWQVKFDTCSPLICFEFSMGRGTKIDGRGSLRTRPKSILDIVLYSK